MLVRTAEQAKKEFYDVCVDLYDILRSLHTESSLTQIKVSF